MPSGDHALRQRRRERAQQSLDDLLRAVGARRDRSGRALAGEPRAPRYSAVGLEGLAARGGPDPAGGEGRSGMYDAVTEQLVTNATVVIREDLELLDGFAGTTRLFRGEVRLGDAVSPFELSAEDLAAGALARAGAIASRAAMPTATE